MRLAVALFGATACWLASGCGSGNSSSTLPICFPGGEQVANRSLPGEHGCSNHWALSLHRFVSTVGSKQLQVRSLDGQRQVHLR